MGSLPLSPESTQSESNDVSLYDLNSSDDRGGRRSRSRRTIREIAVTVNRLVLLTRLEMRYEGGEVAMSHTFDPNPDNAVEFTQKIAEGQVIAGLYGRLHCLDITSIGFVTATLPSCPQFSSNGPPAEHHDSSEEDGRVSKN